MIKPSKIENVRETGGVRLHYACPFCGKETVIELTQGECLDLFDGLCKQARVQDIFPDKSNTIREVMISGICPECQVNTFDDDIEDDEDY